METAFCLSTEEFAARNRVKAQTVRARYCNTGSYFGIRPLKLANGRTSWPDVQVAAADALPAAPRCSTSAAAA